MSHKRYFEQVSLELSTRAILHTIESDLIQRDSESLTRKEIRELQALNLQLATTNTWLHEFIEDLQAQLSEAERKLQEYIKDG